MTWSSFLIKLGAISLLLLAIAFLFSSTYSQLQIFDIYLFSTLIFVVFCVLIFWYAKMISRRNPSFTFFGVVSGSFMIKLLIGLVFLFLYKEWMQPADGKFALHFIIVYIIYTAYEVYFLTKLAKTTAS